MSRSTSAACWPTMTARSFDPHEGGSLALELEESERLCEFKTFQYFTIHLHTLRNSNSINI